MRKERRLRAYYFSQDKLIGLMSNSLEVYKPGLPEDAEIWHVHDDFRRDSIVVTIWSSEFDIVSDNVMPTEWTLMLVRRQDAPAAMNAAQEPPQ